MAKYINKFDTQADFEAYKVNLDYPAINYIAQTEELEWVKEQPSFKFFAAYNDGKAYAITDCSDSTLMESETKPSGYNYRNITEAKIGNCVTSIGQYAFNDCQSLKKISIPNTVTTFGNFSFTACISLQSIDIPDSVTAIGRNAFNQCYSLTSITIPSSVTSIGANAFYLCNKLTKITVNATTPPALPNSTVFASTNECPIYVPVESVEAYKAANGWSTYADRIRPIENRIRIYHNINLTQNDLLAIPVDINSGYTYTYEFTPIDWFGDSGSYYGAILGQEYGDVRPLTLFKIDNGWGTENQRFTAGLLGYNLSNTNTLQGQYRFYDNVKASVTLGMANESTAKIIVENDGYPTYTGTSTTYYGGEVTGVNNVYIFCNTYNNGNAINTPADMLFHKFIVKDSNGNYVYEYIAIDNGDGTYSLKDMVSGDEYPIPSVYTTDPTQSADE